MTGLIAISCHRPLSDGASLTLSAHLLAKGLDVIDSGGLELNDLDDLVIMPRLEEMWRPWWKRWGRARG